MGVDAPAYRQGPRPQRPAKVCFSLYVGRRQRRRSVLNGVFGQARDSDG
jgi:hypothetical protein